MYNLCFLEFGCSVCWSYANEGCSLLGYDIVSMGSEVLQARRCLEPAGTANLVTHYHIQTDLIPSLCSFLLSCNRAASSLTSRHRHLQQQQERPLGVAHSPHCTCGCAVCTCIPPQIVTAGAQETPSPSEPESQQGHKQEDTTSLRCGDMWPWNVGVAYHWWPQCDTAPLSKLSNLQGVTQVFLLLWSLNTRVVLQRSPPYARMSCDSSHARRLGKSGIQGCAESLLTATVLTANKIVVPLLMVIQQEQSWVMELCVNGSYIFYVVFLWVHCLVAHIKGRTRTEGLTIVIRVMGGIFGAKKEVVIGGWRELHDEVLLDVYCSPGTTVWVIWSLQHQDEWEGWESMQVLMFPQKCNQGFWSSGM